MKKLGKIHFRTIEEGLSESEMKFVTGGSGYGYGYGYGWGEGVKPCPKNGCSGPRGAWVPGGLCCTLPCFGVWHDYGFGIVTGVDRCPW